MKKSLRDRAFKTMLYSRFAAREDDLDRALTDDEIRAEAEYLLESIPYGGIFEGAELTKAKAQLRHLLKA